MNTGPGDKKESEDEGIPESDPEGLWPGGGSEVADEEGGVGEGEE